MPGPLVRRAPVRLLGSGAGGALLAAAFALFAVTAAAPPLFTDSAGNAALAAQLRAVPGSASADTGPVVRVVGSPRAQGDGARTLSRIPGLGPTVTTASSIGVELHPLGPSGTDVTGPSGTAPARLFGQARPASALVAASRTPTRQGLWLPVPVARAIGAGAGDTVRVGRGTGAARVVVSTTVAGLYRVSSDGRSPADPPESRLWARRRAVLPADSQFGSRPAYLMVGALDTVTELARTVGDDLLVAVEGRLDPPVPTLRQAMATSHAVERQVVLARDTPRTGPLPGPVRYQVLSGLPTLVDHAAEVADRTTAWTSTVGTAGLLLGLVTVLAAARLSVRRRAVEVRHGIGTGLRPAALGALAAAEALPVAALCAGLGLLGAWGLVAGVGPGPVTTARLGDAAVLAALSAAAGVLVTGAVTAVAGLRAARLAPDRPTVAVPWEAGLAAVALTAAAGLWTGSTAGPPGALDLLVPVLVLAAAGAVGGRLLPQLAGRFAPSRPVPALAARRLAAGGAAAVLVVTALTTGLGLLGYSLAAASSVRAVTDDRVAAHAGAQATAGLGPSWLLDPGAPRLPVPDPDALTGPDLTPVPGARVPPLPADETIVWRGRVTLPPEFGNVDLLVVDPARFADVAAWGGGVLRQARGLTSRLAAADATTARALRAGELSRAVPAIGVGDVLQRPGDRATISIGAAEAPDVPFRVLDVVPAFPGFGGDQPMVVVPADSFFLHLGELDPRVMPPEHGARFTQASGFFRTELWSDRGEAGLRSVLDPLGLEPQDTRTLARLAQQPDVVGARSAIGFQVALGTCLAAIGALVLALYADRATDRARPADLLLARMGLGPRGVLRARSVELTALAALALMLAVVGIALLIPLGPRLLDPGGGAAPPFALRPDALAASATAAAAALGLLLAIAAALARGAAGSAEEVLRDAD